MNVKRKVLLQLVRVRLDDAWALLRTDIPARRNGAVYLGGYAVECALKARICTDQNTDWLDPEYHTHNLRGLAEKTRAWDKIKDVRVINEQLVYIETQWHVELRYRLLPRDPSEVRKFLERAEEFAKWLSTN